MSTFIRNRCFLGVLVVVAVAGFALVGGGCETWGELSESRGGVSSATPAPETHYATLSVEEIRGLIPAPTGGSESGFENRLVEATQNLKDDAGLGAWAEETVKDSPFDLIEVLDPDRKNPDGTPVKGEQWKGIYPKTCLLLTNALDDLKQMKYKDAYPRQRPGDSKEMDAYPSGHGTRASLEASVLGQVAPGKSRDLIREAWARGMHRIVLGKHYPTDIAASFVVGRTVGLKMSISQKFQADLEAARAEWPATAR